MSDIIKDNLSDSANGEYALAIKNIKTGETYFLNEKTPYTAASLYKLWVMAETYDQISKGIFSEKDILSQDANLLNQKFGIDPEYAEKTEGEITFSVEEAIKQMIEISDNYAALLLADKVKMENVSAFLRKQGLTHSSIGAEDNLPTTTAYDTLLFFEKLYKGELANSEYI